MFQQSLENLALEGQMNRTEQSRAFVVVKIMFFHSVVISIYIERVTPIVMQTPQGAHTTHG